MKIFGSKAMKVTANPRTPGEINHKNRSAKTSLGPSPPSRQQRAPDPIFEPSLLKLPQHY